MHLCSDVMHDQYFICKTLRSRVINWCNRATEGFLSDLTRKAADPSGAWSHMSDRRDLSKFTSLICRLHFSLLRRIMCLARDWLWIDCHAFKILSRPSKLHFHMERPALALIWVHERKRRKKVLPFGTSYSVNWRYRTWSRKAGIVLGARRKEFGIRSC